VIGRGLGRERRNRDDQQRDRKCRPEDAQGVLPTKGEPEW